MTQQAFDGIEDGTDPWQPARTAPLLTPRSARTMTLFLIGRIMSDRCDTLCCIRNLSAGGLKAEVRAPFVVGEPIRIEFRNGDIMPSSVRWVDRRAIGVQFDTPVDVERMLSECSTVRRPSAALAPRAPRMPTNCPAEVRIEGRVHRVSVEDLSQGGAKLATALPLEKDMLLTLTVPGLDPLRGVVRWVRGDRVGVAFLEPIAFAVLAEWLNDPSIRYAAILPGE